MTHDYQSCGGPTQCDYCRRTLDESIDEAVARMRAEDRERTLRGASLRTNIHTEDIMDNDDAGRALQGFGSLQLDIPPDGYEAPLARMRAAQGIVIPDDSAQLRAMQTFRDDFRDMMSTSRRAAEQPATCDTFLSPPNGYDIALKALEHRR